MAAAPLRIDPFTTDHGQRTPTIPNHKPIIGLLGGIGSGKSHIARLFAELGCLVIDADAAVRAALLQPDVQAQLQQWWGPQVIRPDGSVDRAAIASKVFTDASERIRLENLLHPLVAADRRRRMAGAAGNNTIQAFVWDVPLLMETQLDRECDALVFVDAPPAVRLARLAATRRWTAADLAARENCQLPLDKKRNAAHDVVVNAAEADDEVRNQVRAILTRILERFSAPGKGAQAPA